MLLIGICFLDASRFRVYLRFHPKEHIAITEILDFNLGVSIIAKLWNIA